MVSRETFPQCGQLRWDTVSTGSVCAFTMKSFLPLRRRVEESVLATTESPVTTICTCELVFVTSEGSFRYRSRLRVVIHDHGEHLRNR